MLAAPPLHLVLVFTASLAITASAVESCTRENECEGVDDAPPSISLLQRAPKVAAHHLNELESRRSALLKELMDFDVAMVDTRGTDGSEMERSWPWDPPPPLEDYDCSGSQALKKGGCYRGTARYLWQHQTIEIVVHDDYSNETENGHINISGSGYKTFKCEQKPFNVSSQQEIMISEVEGCAPKTLIMREIKNCGDQDVIQSKCESSATGSRMTMRLKWQDAC